MTHHPPQIPYGLATYTRLSGKKSWTKCLSHATTMTTVARRLHGTTLVTVLCTNRLSHVTDLAAVTLLLSDPWQVTGYSVVH
jgi:hypothetical protein